MQQELFRRGGKRKGAGRKPNGRRAGSRHEKRPLVKPQFALHIVMRVVAAVGNMRRRAVYKAVREATITAALRERIRIVHVSIQRTHVHMRGWSCRVSSKALSAASRSPARSSSRAVAAQVAA